MRAARSLITASSEKSINKTNICKNNDFIYKNKTNIYINKTFIYSFQRRVADFPPVSFLFYSAAACILQGIKPVPLAIWRGVRGEAYSVLNFIH